MPVQARAVELTYQQLADPNADIGEQLKEAYGPAGLGILTVSGVPGFHKLRRQLLPLAAELAALPEPARAQLEDPASCYNFGWSCGREILEGGQPDTWKGSFYANPLHDQPSAGNADLQRRYPAYCAPNVWPRDDLPNLEAALKALGRLIINVGLLLTRHCDKYCAATAGYPPRLHDILQYSPCPKARLLHYFAPDAAAAANPAASTGAVNWCGWHTDHGSLTGLCSAMYLDSAGQPAACLDPQAGLHIKDRSGQVIQVSIPEHNIGYQIGEAMQVRSLCALHLDHMQTAFCPLTAQVHSGGLLRGTPHCVVAPRPELSSGISRNTFAVFMQPQWDCPIDTPANAKPEDVGIGQWRPGLDFGSFSELTFNVYYKCGLREIA